MMQQAKEYALLAYMTPETQPGTGESWHIVADGDNKADLKPTYDRLKAKNVPMKIRRRTPWTQRG